MRELDRDARGAIEHAAFVIHADAAPQHEAFAEIVRRPPLADAGREIVAAGERRVVGADPAAERDLHAEQHQADDHQPAHRRDAGQADRHVGRAPRHPGQQRERQQAAEQMAHHHDRLEQPGHRPHAEQGLEDDHRQGQRRDAREVVVRPAQRGGEQQDRLAERRERAAATCWPCMYSGMRDGDQHAAAAITCAMP